MATMDKIKAEIKKLAEEYYTDHEAVKMIEELIDEEYTNTEVITSLLDRVEELEDKVESLNKSK